MELRLPTSMTALINIKFRYDEETRKLSGEVDLQLLDELMGEAKDLQPDLQEILIRFAQSLNKTSGETIQSEG